VGEIRNTVILIPSAYRLPGVPPDPCTNWSETFVIMSIKKPRNKRTKNNQSLWILN